MANHDAPMALDRLAFVVIGIAWTYRSCVDIGKPLMRHAEKAVAGEVFVKRNRSYRAHW